MSDSEKNKDDIIDATLLGIPIVYTMPICKEAEKKLSIDLGINLSPEMDLSAFPVEKREAFPGGDSISGNMS